VCALVAAATRRSAAAGGSRRDPLPSPVAAESAGALQRRRGRRDGALHWVTRQGALRQPGFGFGVKYIHIRCPDAAAAGHAWWFLLSPSMPIGISKGHCKHQRPPPSHIDQLRGFFSPTSCLKKSSCMCIAKMDGWNNPPET